jgi:hypothetical protein
LSELAHCPPPLPGHGCASERRPPMSTLA